MASKGEVSNREKEGAPYPSSTLLDRWLQYLAVVGFCSFNAICWLVLLLALRSTYLRRPSLGGRTVERVRRSLFFQYFAGYFPIKLLAEEPLEPKEKHLIVYHPHGIIGIGCVAGFGSDAAGFSQVFPGLRIHLTTLPILLRTPIYRDILLAMGFIDVSASSIARCLEGGEGGNSGGAVALVLGGAEEALDSHPGTYDVIMDKRLGFVKLALTTGSHLVPALGFGETDLWHQAANPRGSILRQMQVKLMKTLKFSCPILFHIMPKRRAITVIVGKKIAVEKVEKPTADQIQALHADYKKALATLFERHKDKYAPNRKGDLRIVA